VIHLPTAVSRQALSSWSGRPDGLRIDPIGVEAVADVPGAGPAPYVHVLTHQDLAPERVRSWQRRQIAQHLVRQADADAQGDPFNRLVDDRLDALADLDWGPATVLVDGRPVPALLWQAGPLLWAAYLEQGEDRVALIASDVPVGAIELRTASADEARALRTEALRV